MRKNDLKRMLEKVSSLNIDTGNIHNKGVERHGVVWLRANEAAVSILARLGVDSSAPDMKILCPLIVIHVLDVAKASYGGPNPEAILRHAADYLYVEHGIRQSKARQALGMNEDVVSFYGTSAEAAILDGAMWILREARRSIITEGNHGRR